MVFAVSAKRPGECTLAEFSKEPGRPLDVSEDERDLAARLRRTRWRRYGLVAPVEVAGARPERLVGDRLRLLIARHRDRRLVLEDGRGGRPLDGRGLVD